MSAAALVPAIFLMLLASSIGFVWGFYSPRQERWAAWALAVGWILTTGRLLAAAATVHGFPATTPSMFADLLVWLVVGAFPLWARRARWAPLGGFVLPGLTLVWLAGQLVDPRVPVFGAYGPATPWLVPHVVVAAASYGCFLVAAAAAGMYLEHERELLRKTPRVFYYRLPALAATDRWSYRLTALGWVLLSLAILTGGLFAHSELGRTAAVTVKEMGSLVVWGLYALYLVLRLGGWRGHRAAWLTVGAFLAVVGNFVGLDGLLHGVSAWRDYGA